MSAHELSVGGSNEWYTPPHVFEAMGTAFDLDVAHPGLDVVDWIPTRRILTEDGLTAPWTGFVWMNPPFGSRNGIVPWLDRFFVHGNGVALCPDRTSAPWWQIYAAKADAILFVSPKIHFIPGAGVTASSPGTGTTLFAAGALGVSALLNATRNGLGLMVQPKESGQ